MKLKSDFIDYYDHHFDLEGSHSMLFFPFAPKPRAKLGRQLRGFLPQAIMNDTGLTRETVIKECLELVNEGILKVIYESDCPNCFSIVTYGDKPEAKTVDYCWSCGEEDIVVEEDNYSHRFI